MIAVVGITTADRAATVTIDPAAIVTSLQTCPVTTGPGVIARQRIVHRRITGRLPADRVEETAFPTTGRCPLLRVPEATVLLTAEEGLAEVRRRPASVVAPAAWEDLAVEDLAAEALEAAVVGGKI